MGTTKTVDLMNTFSVQCCMSQRRTNLFQRGGAEVKGRLTGRGSGGRSPPVADNNMAVTQPQITIILLLS